MCCSRLSLFMHKHLAYWTSLHPNSFLHGFPERGIYAQTYFSHPVFMHLLWQNVFRTNIRCKRFCSLATKQQRGNNTTAESPPGERVSGCERHSGTSPKLMIKVPFLTASQASDGSKGELIFKNIKIIKDSACADKPPKITSH